MSDVESVANKSVVTHPSWERDTRWGSHLWEERGACPHCGTDSHPVKEPSPPATEERIEDISEVLTIELSEPRRVFDLANEQDRKDWAALANEERLKLFTHGEMTDGD